MDNIIVNDNELLLYGYVGDSWDGFTSGQVISALAAMGGKPVSVRINSFGGYCYEGVAIYNALKNYSGEVTVYVDSMAASAASVIAMAGAKVIMRKGSLMMIHDPWNMTIGNIEDHEASIKMLEVTADSLAAIYAAKTGRSVEEIRAEMKEELWLSPPQAIEKKYADAEEGEAVEAAAFDYRVFAKAPEPLKALAAAKGWKNRPSATAAPAAQPPKESTMTTKTEAAPNQTVDAAAIEAAAMARVNAIMDICNSAGEPAMAQALIRENVTAEQAKARVEGARDIRAAVTRANKLNPKIEMKLADQYIAAATSVEKVRSDLFNLMADSESHTSTNGTLPQDGGQGGGARAAKSLEPFAIYQKRQQARVDRGRAKGFLA